MRKALLAALVAIAALFVTPVLAANLPVKAPPAPVVAATTYDWSGFYGGIGAGWAVNCRSITAKEDIVRVRLTGKWNPFEYAAPAPVTTRY